MAEPSRRRRRRSYASESNPPARGPNIYWWLSDEGRHAEHLERWKERKVLRQKFADLNWFTVNQFQFSQKLVEQGVQHLLQLRGHYYPDLVRVFYYNLKVQNGIVSTRVKGVDIILVDDIWTNVAHLPILANNLHVPNDFGDFNKIVAYRSFMRNPQQPLPNRRYLLVGHLRMEERVLHYLIVWLLCPRGSNLAQCLETDLMLMSAITQNLKINWASLISDTIVRAKRYERAHLPYPLLISLICIYKGVDVTGERFLSVLPTHQIEESALHQMGFIRQGNMFVRAEGDNAQDAEESDEAIPMPDPTNVAGSSHPPQEYSLERVDVTGERFLSVLPTHQIEESALHQMGFIRQGNMFVRAEGDNAQDAEESDEEDEAIPMPHPTNVAGPSHPPQEYSLESISRQIEAMAFMQQTRMDDMMAYHNRRYDEINTHLKEIDDKLAKLYVPDSDDES
ncbi:hypothetical protein LR48_Vigan05g104600 [Vigna angularis]|uniref:Putative plant transposon protein domain-containing protein n=1 Tax=Phaseolus angularis TaxID=3914 RepID=A0A0L9ULM5_PHAAN|nr:hypothetical protein LR48_Vigan05g104600 [Vigna angularis]